MKQFDFIPAFIDENKNITARWVSVGGVLYQTAQAIKTFPHVGGFTKQVKAVFCR